jgi:hypothetical protein
MSGFPPGPKSMLLVLVAATGDECVIDKSNRRIGFSGCARVGNVNPFGADASMVPTLTDFAIFPAWNAMLTPVNVKVAVFVPDPIVIELVPDPVHGTVRRHVKAPRDVSTVLNTTSPLGRMVYGSAFATRAVRTEKTMRARVVGVLM